MKFIHASDLHVRAAEAEDQLNTLRAIVTLARERQADFILMAGDLFDSDHDANLLRPQVVTLDTATGKKIQIDLAEIDENKFKHSIIDELDSVKAKIDISKYI